MWVKIRLKTGNHPDAQQNNTEEKIPHVVSFVGSWAPSYMLGIVFIDCYLMIIFMIDPIRDLRLWLFLR